MNKKWISGISLTVLLCVGILGYITTASARANAITDKNLENLTQCASEKNPLFLANVLNGAVIAFDKDVRDSIKAENTQGMEKPRKALLEVFSFALKSSKHFSPIYKNIESQPKFDQAINGQIQKMYKTEFKLAKDPKVQGTITKDYRAIVKALEADGVKGLSKIVSPTKADKKAKKKSKGGIKDKIKKLGRSVEKGVKNGAKRLKTAAGNAKVRIEERLSHKKSQDYSIDGQDNQAADDTVEGDDADGPADNSDEAYGDDTAENDEADGSADNSDEESGDNAPADSGENDNASDNDADEESGDDAPADSGKNDDESDNDADEESRDDVSADSDEGDDAPADSGENYDESDSEADEEYDDDSSDDQ